MLTDDYGDEVYGAIVTGGVRVGRWSDSPPEPPKILGTYTVAQVRALSEFLSCELWCWAGSLADPRYVAMVSLEHLALVERADAGPPCWRITAAGRVELQVCLWSLLDKMEAI